MLRKLSLLPPRFPNNPSCNSHSPRSSHSTRTCESCELLVRSFSCLLFCHFFFSIAPSYIIIISAFLPLGLDIDISSDFRRVSSRSSFILLGNLPLNLYTMATFPPPSLPLCLQPLIFQQHGCIQSHDDYFPSSLPPSLPPPPSSPIFTPTGRI